MPSHKHLLYTAVRKFFLQKRFFDVVLCSNIDEATVPAHSLVLAAYSGYFCEECMNCRRLDKPFVVHLDIKSVIIKNLVDYCYTGNANITEDNMIELLMGALFLEIDIVIEECKKFIIKHLSPTNCLEVVACAEEKKCSDLLEQAEEYLYDNLLLISETERFLQLSLEELQNILAKNRKACSEEQIFNGVLKWVEHNQRTKEQYLPKLLPKIRIKSLETEFVLDNLDLIQLSAEALKEAQELLMEEYTSTGENLVGKNLAETTLHENPDKVGAKLSAQLTGKIDYVLLIIGCNQRLDKAMPKLLPAAQVERYLAKEKDWVPLRMMQEFSYNFGAVCVNESVIIVGGTIDGEATACVVRMPLVSMQFEEMNFMKAQRACPAVAAVNNYVYAIGGADASDEDINTVERLDLSSGNWEYVANLNEARKGAGVAILDGVLYVVGGSYQGKPLRTVERYDVATNKWINCPMTKERQHHGVATFKEYIYAVGGRDRNADCLNSVERYDPLKDAWTKVCDLKRARAGLSCILFENHLYAIGGRIEGTVETYDPDVDEWEMDSHLSDFYNSCIALTTR